MDRTAPQQLLPEIGRSIHCLGVGGTGMAPLAIYLAQSGFEVSGEDDALSGEVAGLLHKDGIRVGPMPDGCALAVRSSAIHPGHPGLSAAAARGVPVARRGEVLAEAVRGLKLVAVCGSHGKTTTTAMLVTAILGQDSAAGYLLGGLFADGTSPGRAGSNGWVVAEVDESDGTIERFEPEVCVAVNLDWDHPDQYRSADEFQAAFAALFRRTRSAVLINAACPRSLAAAAGLTTVHTFGETGQFTGKLASQDEGGITLSLGGRFPAGQARVAALGSFNASNATAALAAARLMGLSPGPLALARDPGVRRRQSVLSAEGPVVVEDYAHHPTEIRELMASLRARVQAGGRLVAVFQPHRFSRTAQFKAEFASALSLADRVVLLEVYPAGETPVAGGTSADIRNAMARLPSAPPAELVAGGRSELAEALSRMARPADLVAFIGAGDIDRLARQWVGAGRKAPRGPGAWDELATALAGRLGAASRLRREEPLAPKTTMRVGGAARLYAEPQGEADLAILLRECASRAVPVLALGRGSNLIVPDDGVDAVVVCLSGEGFTAFEPRPGGAVWVGAGLRLKNLCGLAAQAGLAGFEFLEGIPGSVGGALRMNAGAMGGWIFDLVEEVRVMSPQGQARTLRRDQMGAGYRDCAELREGLALGALLRPRGRAETAEINRQIEQFRRKRHDSQPREPSAGCMFKNPQGDSAGRLIDASGLKGERVGDAEVSPVHANFIINRGNATAADVLELVRRVRERVRSAQGVELEPEALLFGRSWGDFL